MLIQFRTRLVKLSQSLEDKITELQNAIFSQIEAEDDIDSIINPFCQDDESIFDQIIVEVKKRIEYIMNQ